MKIHSQLLTRPVDIPTNKHTEQEHNLLGEIMIIECHANTDLDAGC